MSTSPRPWLTQAQFRALAAALRVVDAWVMADEQPELALDHALRREPDLLDATVGLATVTRMMAIELAAATGSTEAQVLGRVGARVRRLQYPVEAEAAVRDPRG